MYPSGSTNAGVIEAKEQQNYDILWSGNFLSQAGRGVGSNNDVCLCHSLLEACVSKGN